jgi:glycosyltransferase involved in cell wall biosynthesis
MLPEWLRQGVTPVVGSYAKTSDWDLDVPKYQVPQLNLPRSSRFVPLWGRLANRTYNRACTELLATVVKKHNCNVIFSFSNPQESNYIGALLSARNGLPFVSHFSDPWYDNPYKQRWWRPMRSVLAQERFIIEQSRRVVFVSEQLRELVMKKYPSNWAHKALVIPHCFNSSEYPTTPKQKNDVVVLSHIGAFYKERNPEPLFAALQMLFAKSPELKKRVRLELVGASNTYTGFSAVTLPEVIAKYGLTEVVAIAASVNYQESLVKMYNADGLIVIDANFAQSPFLPSKLVDYAGSGTPIIGITPTGSASDEFLKGLGCHSFSYTQLEELATYLHDFITGVSSPQLSETFVNQFKVQNTTAKLLETMRETLRQ